MHRWSLLWTLNLLVVLVALCASAACREHDPPPPAAKDLGTPERPLLPSADPAYDQSILGGRAAPIAAADIIPEEPEETAADEVVDGRISDAERGYIVEVVELTVRALAEGKYNELADYIVPEQREPLSQLLTAGGKLVKAVGAFATALEAKAPGTLGQIVAMTGPAASLPGLDADGPLDLSADRLVAAAQVNDLHMTSASTAAATLGAPGRGMPVEFSLIDDEWYVGLPAPLMEPELVASLTQISNELATQLTDIATRLSDDSLTPEQVKGELTAAMQQVQPTLMALLPKLMAAMAKVGGAGPEAAEGAEVSEAERQQIAELIEFMEEALTNRRVDELLDLVVPSTRDQIRPLYTAMLQLLTALDGLAKAMEDQEPGSGAAVEEFGGRLAPHPTTEGLRQTEPGKAQAIAAAGGGSLRHEFELIDGDWYYRDADLALAEAALQAKAQAMSQAAEQVETLAGRVADGSVAPGDVASGLSAILSAVAAAGPSTPEPAEALDSDDEEPAEPEEAPPVEEPTAPAGRGPSSAAGPGPG